MSFVKSTSGDYLNTNTIAKVRPVPNGTSGSGGARFVEEAKRDGAVPIPESVFGGQESASAPVIPSAPITLAVFVYTADDGDGRPVAVRADPVPVIGWRVHKDNTASPAFAFKPNGRATMLLPVGNERLVGPGGQFYKNLDDAKQAVLAAAQQRYDSDRPAEIETVEQKVEPIKLVGGRRHAAR